MRLARIAGMGLSGLLGTPLRTALAALGIVIGVAAVVMLTSLGNGIQRSVSGQITALGPNLITISPGSEEGGGGPFGASAASTLTPSDTDRVAELPSVSAASSNVSATAPVDGTSVSFSGVDPSYREIRSVELASGRFLEDRGEAVLSTSDARELLDASPEEAVGRTLTIGGAAGGDSDSGEPPPEGSPEDAPQGAPEDLPEDLPEGVPEGFEESIPEGAASPGDTSSGEGSPGEDPSEVVEEREFEVVGVARAEPSGFGPPVPQSSYLATRDALELSGAENVGQILASAESAEAVGDASDSITQTLRGASGAEDFTVVTQEELLSTFTEVTDQLNIFLAGIAGISLLVGGIGIMNIMLVSVAERTREIGVRKALGATDADVLLQFLFEAVLLAVLGGIVGVGLGVGASELLPRLLADLPAPVFTAAEISLAFGVAALIGVVFGSLPAYRSARLAPVEALRRE